MALNRLTPVPPIAPSTTEETASCEDAELQQELDEWRQHMTTLNEKENFEDQVIRRHAQR